MKKNNNRKNSAAKKLIPAVAMLTTSAVMLSTATYAWFTLNKEVEVTGIKMQATAGDSLEVSLGALGNNVSNVSLSTDAPGVNDVSWKRSIDISEYYDSVGKLKPASSFDGITLFHTGDQGIYAGGREVEENTAVEAADIGKKAALNIGSEYKNDTFAVSDSEEGYFIDIPVYLRCARNETTKIDCAVSITDGTTGEESNKDLAKAVRVAVIPTLSASKSEGIAAPGYTADENSATVKNVSKSVLFALNDDAYHGTVIKSSGIYKDAVDTAPLFTDKNIFAASASARQNFSARDPISDNTVDDAAVAPLTTVFELEAADANDYSVESFFVRVWLEGESEYCNDATANQDWNIDLYFTIHEDSNPSGDTSTEETETTP